LQSFVVGLKPHANPKGNNKDKNSGSSKGRNNFLKIPSPFEQKSDCAGAVIATVLATQVSAPAVDIAE